MPQPHDSASDPDNGTDREDAFPGAALDDAPPYNEEDVDDLMDEAWSAADDIDDDVDEAQFHEPVGRELPEPEDVDDELDDLEDDFDELEEITEVTAGAGPVTVGYEAASTSATTEARLERLEAAARALAAAEVVREDKRVKRKVKAATTGAATSGFVPILLQLAGALDLSPEMAATVSTVASLIGAFVGGWATPERRAPLPAPAAHSLLNLGDETPGVRVE